MSDMTRLDIEYLRAVKAKVRETPTLSLYTNVHLPTTDAAKRPSSVRDAGEEKR